MKHASQSLNRCVGLWFTDLFLAIWRRFGELKLNLGQRKLIKLKLNVYFIILQSSFSTPKVSTKYFDSLFSSFLSSVSQNEKCHYNFTARGQKMEA